MADGFDDLLQDHRHVREQLLKFREDKDDGVAHDVCTELALHAAAEEAALYPHIRGLGSGESETGVDDGIELTERAELEHADIAALTARVLATPPPDLGEVMAQIDSLFTAHVRFEEDELFPRLRPIVEAEALHRALSDARAAIRERSGTPLA